MKVLLVDDDALNRDLQGRILRRLGCEVTVVSSGEEGVEKAPGGYDLIFMDCRLPGIDGIEATRRIREKLAEACPPVVALTGAVDDGDYEEKGFDAVVTKPIAIDDFKRILAEYGKD